MSVKELTLQVYVEPLRETLTVLAWPDDKVRGILEAIGIIIGVPDVDTFLHLESGHTLLNLERTISSYYPDYIFDGAYLEAF